MTNPLDRDIVRKTMAGYAEVNRITDEERRAHLATMTEADGAREFEALYLAWKRVRERDEGSWEEIDAERLAHHIALRQAFATLARKSGLL
jgi:hypothetical protein